MVVLLAISFSKVSNAQTEVLKGYGIGTYVYLYDDLDFALPVQLGIVNLRTPLSKSGNNALTIGSDLAGVIIGGADSRGYAGIGIGANAPIIFDYNVGRGAHADAKGRIGFFVGGGLGLQGIFSSTTDGSSSLMSVGPMANVGLRFRLINVEYTVRASYTVNVTDAPNVAGISILYDRSVAKSRQGGRGGYRFFRNQRSWRNGQKSFSY